MSRITDEVRKLAEPVVRDAGCELWDVEFVKEAGEYFLRVFIDRDGGVSIDNCEAVSRALDPLLDEADPIPQSYTFEVSSAGAERPLKRPSDFEKFMGSPVMVKLYAPKGGSREHPGKLAGFEDGAVVLDTSAGRERFEKNEIAGVRLRIE